MTCGVYNRWLLDRVKSSLTIMPVRKCICSADGDIWWCALRGISAESQQITTLYFPFTGNMTCIVTVSAFATSVSKCQIFSLPTAFLIRLLMTFDLSSAMEHGGRPAHPQISFLVAALMWTGAVMLWLIAIIQYDTIRLWIGL